MRKNNDNRDRVVYISGPITMNKDWRRNFDLAYARLKAEGYGVVYNPREIGDSVDLAFDALGRKPDYAEYMRADLKMLLKCDTVYMLKGWEGSAGAGVELSVAKACKMHVIFEEGADGLQD